MIHSESLPLDCLVSINKYSCCINNNDIIGGANIQHDIFNKFDRFNIKQTEVLNNDEIEVINNLLNTDQININNFIQTNHNIDFFNDTIINCLNKKIIFNDNTNKSSNDFNTYLCIVINKSNKKSLQNTNIVNKNKQDKKEIQYFYEKHIIYIIPYLLVKENKHI